MVCDVTRGFTPRRKGVKKNKKRVECFSYLACFPSRLYVFARNRLSHPKAYQEAKDRLRTIKDFLPLFATKPLPFESGTKRAYSNGGYIVLGAIVEKVSGENYYDPPSAERVGRQIRGWLAQLKD